MPFRYGICSIFMSISDKSRLLFQSAKQIRESGVATAKALIPHAKVGQKCWGRCRTRLPLHCPASRSSIGAINGDGDDGQ